VFVYIDDILISSRDEDEHQRHTRIVLDRIKTANLALSFNKCEFNADSIDFLGHRVSAEGIAPLPEKVKEITDFPLPSTIAQLKGFLGLINWYRRFLKNAADYLGVLDEAAKTNRKRDPTPVTWTPERAAAFQRAKDAIADLIQMLATQPSEPH
jgi:cleavage and polyadenylation specificity factor subunit 1